MTDTHTLPNGDPDDCHLVNNWDATLYTGTDLVPDMAIRLDGRDWLIEHISPYSEMRVNRHYSSVPRVTRDAEKSILHLNTFIRHEGQHHAAYVINNTDTFYVIV